MDEALSRKTFLRHTLSAAAVRGVARLKGFIVLPLIAKAFGTETYGAWAQLMAVLAFCIPFTLFGLSAITRKFFITEGDTLVVRRTFWAIASFAIAASALLIGILVVFADPIARALFKAPVGSVIVLASAIIPLTALHTLLTDVLLAFRAVRRWSVLVLLRECIEIGLLLSLLVFPVSSADILIILVLITIVSSAIAVVVGVFLTRREAWFARPDFIRARSYFRVGWPLFVSGFAGGFILIGGRFVLGVTHTLREVGVYTGIVAVSAVAFQALGEALAISLLPTLSALWAQQRREEATAQLARFLGAYFALGLPMLFGLTAIANDLLALSANADFAASWYLVPIIATGFFAYHGLAIADYVFVTVERTRTILIGMGAAVVVNMALNVLLIPTFGMAGAAVSILITYVAYGVAIVIAARRYLAISIPMTRVWRSAIASFIMFSVVSRLRFDDVSGLVSAILIGTLLSVGAYGALTAFRTLALCRVHIR
ncbi:MAG: oligosaccharide flippase family protein [bacterium]|nr:oligosaccharide flippase family protein [bacterium]